MFVFVTKICTVLNALPILHVSDLLGTMRPILPAAASQAPAYGLAKAGRANLENKCGLPRAYDAPRLESGTAVGFIQLTVAHMSTRATEIYSGIRLSTSRFCVAHWANCLVQLPLNMTSSKPAHSQYIRNSTGRYVGGGVQGKKKAAKQETKGPTHKQNAINHKGLVFLPTPGQRKASCTTV
jgi:hypothetical protein